MSDYIKRDDAIRMVRLQGKNAQFDGMAQDVAPVRHGHWIKISPAGIYECSECQKNVMTSDIEAYEYCHGCGARMDGGDDEID